MSVSEHHVDCGAKGVLSIKLQLLQEIQTHQVISNNNMKLATVSEVEIYFNVQPTQSEENPLIFW